MPIGSLTLIILLPVSASLKEKRHQIKPILNRLHKEFNISVAEYAQQDSLHFSTIRIALVCNDHRKIESQLRIILGFFRSHWPDVQVIDDKIEVLY
ncbi:MAG: DUF503 domain-containing protein [Anaerolineaceae bacterium]|nr:DUF503 domain-containing protein [Anaerolineaceae bacterium]